MTSQAIASDVAIRHSIAPRVLDGSVVQQSLLSTQHLSVRATAPDGPNSPILTTFVWKDAGARVHLAGSFDDWRKHEMTFVPDVRTFVLVAEVPPGSYFYRFVVDGRWRIAEDDPNLREDMFGELSHFLEISAQSVSSAEKKRYSSATTIRSHVTGDPVLDEGASDTEGEGDDEEEREAEGEDGGDYDETGSRKSVVLPPRQRGSGYVDDYDNDPIGELDLQADVFEAMKDIAEKTVHSPAKNTAAQSDVSSPNQSRKRKKPGRRVITRVWAMLFGEVEKEPPAPVPPTRNQNAFAMAGRRKSGKRGLRVWFPNERNFPEKTPGRKVAPAESKDVLDVGQTAMRLHEVEENANNRQLVGKTLFAQGKYDAALALFSLSVKLRVDNGLKNAKSTAIAHTDVASAFIHLEDYKNAEKHLRIALAIFEKGTFSGGRVQLGDVHCFLGVVADMRNDLSAAELGYRNAIDLYEKSRSIEQNHNYSTAVDNLNQNLKRQKQAEMAGEAISVVLEPGVGPSHQPVESPPAKMQDAPSPVRRASRNRPPRSDIGSPKSAATGRSVRSPPRKPARRAAKPKHEEGDELPDPNSNPQGSSKRPKTWKDLADYARASMPQTPPLPVQDTEESVDGTTQAGSYEDMSRGWHQDGRKLLMQGNYKEAIDMYTLAIYTRKRHGPWRTTDNAKTHVEYARALFASKDLRTASEALRDAITILEDLNDENNALLLGETWGSLGAVLDRLGGHMKEAETAHCAGMVVYGRAGVDKEDKRWMKAWRNLCASLATQGQSARSTDEVWDFIDMQIRGVTPMSKVSSVVLNR